jgi:hypothetical protein
MCLRKIAVIAWLHVECSILRCCRIVVELELLPGTPFFQGILVVRSSRGSDVITTSSSCLTAMIMKVNTAGSWR